MTMGASANRLAAFNDLAQQKGQKYGVNPNFIKAIISVESAGNINAVSPVGAKGLMQLMPATAERMGVSRSELFMPERNMEAGVKYISYLSRLFNNDPRLVAAGYNAGEGAVMKYKGIPPYRETQNYAPAVVARFQLLEACGDACYTREHMANPQKYLSMVQNGGYVPAAMPSATPAQFGYTPSARSYPQMRSNSYNYNRAMSANVPPTNLSTNTPAPVAQVAPTPEAFVKTNTTESKTTNSPNLATGQSHQSPVIYNSNTNKKAKKPTETPAPKSADFVQVVGANK